GCLPGPARECSACSSSTDTRPSPRPARPSRSRMAKAPTSPGAERRRPRPRGGARSAFDSRSPASRNAGHVVMAPPSQLSSLLANTELFGKLPAEIVDQLAERLHTVQFKRGQTIYERGDAGNSLYLIKSGQIRFSVVSGDG